MRFLTLNLQHLTPVPVAEAERSEVNFAPLPANADVEQRVRLLAQQIHRLNVDVVALQEVDGERRSKGGNQAYALAKELGMEVRYAPSAFGYGNAILSARPIRGARYLRLPAEVLPLARDPRKKGLKAWRFNWPEPRVALFAIIDGDGGRPVVIASTHLDIKNVVARRQLQVMTGAIDPLIARYGLSTTTPWLVAGDFNLASAEVAQALGKVHNAANLPARAAAAGWRGALPTPQRPSSQVNVLTSAVTYPNWAPRTQIDYFIGDGVQLIAEEPIHTAVSDHAGILAEIEVDAGGSYV